MCFLCWVAGLRVRSLHIWREVRVEPLHLHVERGQLRWFGHLVRMPPGCLGLRFTKHTRLGGDPGVNSILGTLEIVAGARNLWDTLLGGLAPLLKPG